MKFTEIKINDLTLKAIKELGFEEMSPIQEKSIEVAIDGSDIVGQAQTGTGKTAAFVIPILERLTKDKQGTKHLVMAPTRELALQIETEFKKIGKYHKFSITTIVGGVDFSKQIRELKQKPNVIIATPGRLIDHMSKNRLDFKNLQSFVIDEVDEMFKNGFKEEIDQIVEQLPSIKQTMLFSATISGNVKKIVKETCYDAKYITVSSGKNVNKNITQSFIIIKEEDKLDTLIDLLRLHNREATVIFGRTKRRAEELGEALVKNGFNAGSLHGDLDQKARNRILKRFKDGAIDILVATDVAARGIDVQNITHVYNFDLPQETEFYTHRIGRTGRANRKGKAISFCRKEEMRHIERIMKETNAKISREQAPNPDSLEQANTSKVFASVEALIENGKEFDEKAAKIIHDCFTRKELAETIIKLMQEKAPKNTIKLTKEPAVRVREQKKNYSKSRGKRNHRRRPRARN